jgi:hypothetical protein
MARIRVGETWVLVRKCNQCRADMIDELLFHTIHMSASLWKSLSAWPGLGTGGAAPAPHGMAGKYTNTIYHNPEEYRPHR